IGIRAADVRGERAYQGWSVERLRKGFHFLAQRGGKTEEELFAGVREWLAAWIGPRQAAAEQASRVNAAKSAGHALAQVERSLTATPERALARFQLASLYEQRIGGELERTMRLLDGLQARRLSDPLDLEDDID